MRERRVSTRFVSFVIMARPGVPIDHTSFDVPLADTLAMFDSLGLEVTDFGALEARTVAPLCRRRLWPARAPRLALRKWIEQLLALAERAGDGMILFS